MYPAAFGCGSILANPLYVATQTLICTPAWLTRQFGKAWNITTNRRRKLLDSYFVWNETRMHQHTQHAVGFIIGKILNLRTELFCPFVNSLSRYRENREIPKENDTLCWFRIWLEHWNFALRKQCSTQWTMVSPAYQLRRLAPSADVPQLPSQITLVPSPLYPDWQ